MEVSEGVAPARLSVAAQRRSQLLSKSKQNQKVRVALQKVAECSLRAKNPDWTVLSTNSNQKERILNNFLIREKISLVQKTLRMRFLTKFDFHFAGAVFNISKKIFLHR